MTRKEIIDVVSMCYDMLKVGLMSKKTIRGATTDKIYDNLYQGNSKTIKKLPNFQQLACMIFSKVAIETKESSNIWCCLGLIKDINEKNEYENYYIFIDLETLEIKKISILEYGEFCRKNSVVMLEILYPNSSNLLQSFYEYRNYYLSQITSIVNGLDIDNLELDTLGTQYDKIIKQFQKEGKSTVICLKDKLIELDKRANNSMKR